MLQYRGITLLSLSGKIYARVLERRVWPLVECQIQEGKGDFNCVSGTLHRDYVSWLAWECNVALDNLNKLDGEWEV